MRSRSALLVTLPALVLSGVIGFAQQAGAPSNTSCVTCHLDADVFDAEAVSIVSRFSSDMHAAAGLSCHDCHGGNPSPEVSDDIDAAMNARHTENPYLGSPDPEQIPSFCGRCHSDPQYMRRFGPDIRVDQESEYWTSQHGIALKAGRTKVATCVDCHGVHGVLGPTDPESPVFPTRIAQTCGACHSDVDLMRDVRLADGRPMPVDQLVRWQRSVHASAMFSRGDLTAPTCNDCHGNHGAAPPGVNSISFVCGQCHGREARLFRASAKQQAFEDHNEYLEEAEGEGCASCHDASSLQDALAIRSFTECSTCHHNHAVVRPTLAMLSDMPETPCAFCHEGDSVLTQLESQASQDRYLATRNTLLEEARAQFEASQDIFDWLVDQTLELSSHSVPGDVGNSPPRAEFSRLFEKFRIGKSYFTYDNPAGDGQLREQVVQCSSCHSLNPDTGGSPAGRLASQEMLRRMRGLTALTASAERIALNAHRGGVQVNEALLKIDSSVDAQIGLEVLVHTFEASDGSDFSARHEEGMGHASEALEAGEKALGELVTRRRGLLVSLAFIAAVALGLALKIRQISIRESS